MSSEYGQSLTAFKLYKKTSKRTGNEYLYGRWGMLKVIVLKSRETTEDGGEIYSVMLQQAEERPRQDGKPSPEDRAKANAPSQGERASSRPMPNDTIPF